MTVLPTDKQAAAPKPWIHLVINKNVISFENDEAKADIQYTKAPNNKTGFLPYLSEKGPAIICPKAKKVKYRVRTSCVSAKDIFNSCLIRVKAGDTMVIPITGIATITASIFIFGLTNLNYRSLILTKKIWKIIFYQLDELQLHFHLGHKRKFVSNQLLLFHPNLSNLYLIHLDVF